MNDYPEYDAFTLPIVYLPHDSMSPELHQIFLFQTSDDIAISELLNKFKQTEAFCDLYLKSDCRNMYSISTLPYNDYYPRYQRAKSARNYYRDSLYPLSAIILISGIVTTIKWRGKPMKTMSYIYITLAVIFSISTHNLIRRPIYCYTVKSVRLTYISYEERIHLLDSAVQSGDISTESADMARKFIKTLQDSGIR